MYIPVEDTDHSSTGLAAALSAVWRRVERFLTATLQHTLQLSTLRGAAPPAANPDRDLDEHR